MVLVSLLLTNTTSVDDFIWIAHRLRIPYTITFILTTAIRFIPTMELKAQMVIDAQRSRGANWDKSGLVKRIRQYSTVLIPMIVDSIRLSENLAVAMLCRGFGATKRPTLIDQRSFRWIDVIFVLIGFLLLLTAVFLRINDYGRL
jgi:energy-coupling factor transport system permease protein